MNQIVMTWETYLRDLEILQGQVRTTKVDVIVGLVRGGLIPAVSLSHALDIPMFTFDPHCLHADGQPRDEIYLPISPGAIRKVLIVDDIADNGITLTKAKDFFKHRGFAVTTACVHLNKEKSSIVPDHYVNDSKGIWVCYPYEYGYVKEKK